MRFAFIARHRHIWPASHREVDDARLVRAIDKSFKASDRTDGALPVSKRCEIADLHRQLGTTMICVTLADPYCGAQRECGVAGRYADGPPSSPDNLFVASFIGSPKMNFFKAVVTRQDEQALSLEIEGLGPIAIPKKERKVAHGAHIFAGLRPEHIAIEAGSEFEGRVIVAEELGDETLIDQVTVRKVACCDNLLSLGCGVDLPP